MKMIQSLRCKQVRLQLLKEVDSEILCHEIKNEVVVVERSGQRRTNTTTSSKNHEKEEKRPKKGERIEEMMGRYLDMRTKQVQDECRSSQRKIGCRR